MTDMVRAMNPMGAINNAAEAKAAARASALGVVIGAINTAVAGWYSSTPEGQEAAGRVMEGLLGQSVDPAQLEAQAQTGLYFTAALVVLQIVLAGVQWMKPNSVIPILFLVLVIWGLGTSILGLFMPAFAASQPMWLTVFNLGVLAIAAILHIAGIRGANAMNKFRDAPAG